MMNNIDYDKSRGSKRAGKGHREKKRGGDEKKKVENRGPFKIIDNVLTPHAEFSQ
jgi:hypothetical protein